MTTEQNAIEKTKKNEKKTHFSLSAQSKQHIFTRKISSDR